MAMPLVSCVFLSQRLYVSGAAPLGEAAGGGAGVGRGSTCRLLSEALPANWRACAASTRLASACATAARLGCALARSSAPRPRMPTVEVDTVLEGVCALPLLKKLERLRSAPPAAPPEEALAEVMSNMWTQPLVPSAMRTLIQAPWRSPSRVTEVWGGSGARLRAESPGASRS